MAGPDTKDSADTAREILRARLVFGFFLAVALLPAGEGYFWGLDYLQSRWWLSLRTWVWAGALTAFLLVLYVLWVTSRRLLALVPNLRRLTESQRLRDSGKWSPIALGLIAVVLAYVWVTNMQAAIIPKLLHSLSQPERLGTHIVTLDRSYRFRSCDPVTVRTEAGEEGNLCFPGAVHYRIGLTGSVGGTRSAFGYWVEALYFDE